MERGRSDGESERGELRKRRDIPYIKRRCGGGMREGS